MRKLWQRSRSLRRDSQSTKEATGSVRKSASRENLTPSNGEAIPPVPPIPVRLKENGYLNDHGRPSSSNRMQPMLVGVSRPSTDLSRPGTSGSFQNAVTRAADKVTHPDRVAHTEKVAQTASTTRDRGHKRTKSPRYVDIFSIGAPKSSHRSYNEDVAERNIDVKQVAQNATSGQYVPTSRYQEEVASKNAQPGDRMRASIDVPRAALEGHKSRQDKMHQSASAIQAYQVPNTVATVDDVLKFNYARNNKPYAPYAPRQWSGQVRDKAALGPLNSNPQAPPKVIEGPVQSTYQRQAAQNRANSLSLNTKTPLQPRTSYEKSHSMSSMHYPPTSRDYGLSRAETTLTRSVPLAREISNDSNRIAGYEHRNGEHRTGSALSNNSKRINLPNRTIMDLTNEDGEAASEGYPESETGRTDVSHSPVLEEASMRQFHPAQPRLVSPIAAIPEERSDHGRSVDGSRPPTAVSAMYKPFEQAISFSAISTIATTSPTRLETDTSVAMGVPRSEAAQVPNPPIAKLFTVAETEPRRDHEQSAGNLLPNYEAAQERQTTPQSQAGLSGMPDQHTSAPALETPPMAQSQDETASLQTSQESLRPPSTPAQIQQSPESLKTDDFIDPSRSFGVLTRDFAVTPSKPEQASRTDYEPNTSAKVRSPKPPRALNEITNGNTMQKDLQPVQSTSSTYLASFDEDDFRRKQEQARAALIRLQQSLNEDFLNTPPPPAPSHRTKTAQRPEYQHHSSNGGRPVAPTSIFSKVRDHHQTKSREVNGTYKPSGNNLSIHEQVTQVRPVSSDSSKTIKPAQRNRSRSPQPPPQTYSALAEARTRNRSRSKGKGKESEIGQRLADIERLAQQMNRPYSLPLKSPKRKQAAPVKDRSNGPVSPSLPSPGEVSLSSFPLPTPGHSRTPSEMASPPMNMRSGNFAPVQPVYEAVKTAAQHRPATSASSDMPRNSTSRDRVGMLNRRNSTRSQSSNYSSASQFSIPSHLIPDRGSSMRDSLVMEGEE